MSRHSRSSHAKSNLIDRWISGIFGKKSVLRHNQADSDLYEQSELTQPTENNIQPRPKPVIRHKSKRRRSKNQRLFFDSIDQVALWFVSLWKSVVLVFKPSRKRGRGKRHGHQKGLKSKLGSFSFTRSSGVTVDTPDIEQTEVPSLVLQKHRHHQKSHSSRKPKKRQFLFWKYLPREWRSLWENFLFALFLRDSPHDPFLNKEISHEKRPVTVVLVNEVSYFISSLVVFLAAAMTAWLVYQISVMFVASMFNIDSVLYYFEVMFPIGNASAKWSPTNIIAITMAGPLVSLILGLFTYFYLIKKKVVRGFNRLFFLWFSFHLFNYFFGGFVAGVITDQGFGYVANWMFLGMVLKILFSLVSLSILGYAGYRVVPWLLATAGKPERIKNENRVVFLIVQAVLPWLVGSIILLVLRMPNRVPQHANILVYDSIIAGALGVMVMAMFFNRFAKAASVSHRKTNYRIGFIWAISTVAALVLIRVVLSYGLHVVFQFSLRLNFFN